MNWLTNFVLPKIRAVVAKKRGAGQSLAQMPGLRPDAVPPRARGQSLCLRQLRPPSAHVAASSASRCCSTTASTPSSNCPRSMADPLKFRDRKRYSRPAQGGASAKTARNRDAALVAHGTIGGVAAVVCAFDFAFMGGSMGVAVGEALLAAARLAVLQEAALVVVPASGGARMQEGILSLMQMPRTTLAVEMVKEARPALYRGADRPDHRRRLGLLRHAGRHDPGRAGRGDRLRRRAGDRGDHPRETARGLPARRIPARTRHGRHGGARAAS